MKARKWLWKGMHTASALVNFGSEKAKLEQERELFEEDCIREESKFHYLNCMSCILDAQLLKGISYMISVY